MKKEEIYEALKKILVELFEIDAAKVTPQANLYADLEIDSIDAVDLAIQMHSVTGKRLGPEDFKQVRTVQDVVDAVHRVLNTPS